MIKVLNLIDTLRRGGKERQYIELIRGIDINKIEIHTIVFEKRKNGFDEEAKNLSKYFSYYKRRFRWDFILLIDLIKYCRQNNIEILQSWDGMTAFYGFISSLFVNLKFINYSIQDTDPRLTYRHLIKRFILKLSKNIIANQYAGLKVYGVEKRGKVIYNGLDFSRFGEKVEKIRKEKLENHKGEDKFIIGIVANLTEYKDYYTFFNAIKILQQKINNLEVHIIGGGKLAQVYKEYAVRIGVKQEILKYFGRVTNVEDYIPYFDVGVLCSYKEKGEGLSNSVLEYMACGVPPVITDIGAAREIVENGVSGLLFEAGNAEDLANKIMMLYKDRNLRTEIGKNAKKIVSEKFSYDRYIKEFEEYYLSLINNKY